MVQVIREQKAEKQQVRYKHLVQDLQEENNTWLNADNLKSKISLDLFSRQATTGIATKASEHWRWQIVPMNLKRLMSPEFVAANSGLR